MRRCRGLAAAALGAQTARAQDLVPQYPVPGGETFSAGLDDWTPDADAGCTVLGALSDPLCSITNERVADHDGSLRTTFTSTANAFGAADGTGGFTSPQFTVPGDDQIGPATLTLDRILTSDAPLIDSGPAATLKIELIDETVPNSETRTQIAGIDLGATDADWARQLVSLGAGSVQAGHTYRIKTTAQLTSEQAQALQGDVAVGLDTIGIRTDPPPADGLQGPPGTTGTSGTTGETGASGSTGTTGSTGSTGAIGAQGPPGAVIVAPSAGKQPKINSAAARRLLRVDRLARGTTKGPFAGQLRVRVFCKPAVQTRCEGTLKIRTPGRINTALLKGRKRLRKVTLGTGSYQLPRRRIGWPKVMLTPVAQRLLLARGPFRVDALITVLDQDGRQQVLRRTFRASMR
jgi:hypothetical protein